ncbi:MAG TPA: PAS domain S-box protein, partial [Chitinophagaceae bacterium]|nr:PAS domain S-box protein [Chitinophagaceae bacterium]
NFFKPAKNSKGQIIGVIVNAVDVTEKRRSELEILKAKNNLDLLLNNTNEYFVMVDKDLKIILANKAVTKAAFNFLEYNIQVGDFILDILPNQRNEDKERRRQNFMEAFNGKTISSNFEVNTKKERINLFFESNYKPAYDENNHIIAVILTIRDITEIRKAQKLLAESEERWRFALEGSNQGLWDWDIQTGIVYYSESYRKLYGYQEGETVKLGEWQNRIHPEDKDKVANNLTTHLTSDNPYFESVYRYKSLNGEYRWILARGMIVTKDDEGKPLRMIGTHTDITESKENEESFRMLFYSHPLPMWTYDLNTYQFTDINDAAIEHYGYTRSEFLTMTVKDIRPKEELKKLETTIENIRNNKKGNHDGIWTHLKKSGEAIAVQVKSHILEKNKKKFSIVSIIDVTEKLKAEAELLKSEKQYRFLFKSHPLPSWIYDITTLQFLEVNNAATEFYGYTREEFLKMKLPQLYPAEQLEVLEKKWKEEKHKKELSVQQWNHRKKNGNINIVSIRENTILYNNTEARLVVIEDVTEKVKAEKELKDSNERFTLAVKATSDAIYDCDLLNGSIDWGDGLKKLFGYEDEVSFITWDDYIHEDDREKINKSLAAALKNPRKSYWKEEYKFKKKDNSFSYVLDRGYIVRNAEKKAIRIIGAMQDITDLKRKERELEESNERFDTVMSATHDLIWDWNLETGKFYRDKEGLQKVYGVKDAESIQNIFHWLQRIHPEDQEHLQRVIDDILHATDEQTFEVEYRIKRDDGTYSYVYDRGKILCNQEGKPERMIGAAQDITERKKLEQELLQKELDKQKIISKATIDTQEKERTEIGKELHDNVNQVLTTTKLYLELSMTNPDLKDELIQKSAKNVMYVINEIRQLSRSLMNPSIGDLGLVDSIKDLIENINLTRRLHIIMDNTEDVEVGLNENNKLMIFRIIQEAFNNAVRHAKATTVLLSLRKDKDLLHINIFDDGIGFDLSTIKKGAGLNSIQNRVYLANG